MQHPCSGGGGPHGVVPNVLDYDVIVSSNCSCTTTFTFEEIPLGSYGSPYLSASYGLNSLLLFYKDSFGIK